MAKYTNDWATEAIARQYMKNKRSYAVQRGFLEVDAKYECYDTLFTFTFTLNT